MHDICAHILITYEKRFIPVLLYEEWLVGDDPLYLEVWANDPVRAKTPIFNQYSRIAPEP